MPLPAGRYALGPENGKMQVLTYREGIAQKVGHDLVMDVGQWQATLQVGEDGAISSIEVDVDSRSLEVREGLRGVKPLSDKDRREIRKTIDEKLLRGSDITFRSAAVESTGGRLMVQGDLTLAGASRPISFNLERTADEHLTGTMPVTQSQWGIKPYRGFMGALKVRDTVEITVNVQLPPD